MESGASGGFDGGVSAGLALGAPEPARGSVPSGVGERSGTREVRCGGVSAGVARVAPEPAGGSTGVGWERPGVARVAPEPGREAEREGEWVTGGATVQP